MYIVQRECRNSSPIYFPLCLTRIIAIVPQLGRLGKILVDGNLRQLSSMQESVKMWRSSYLTFGDMCTPARILRASAEPGCVHEPASTCLAEKLSNLPTPTSAPQRPATTATPGVPCGHRTLFLGNQTIQHKQLTSMYSEQGILETNGLSTQ